MVLPQIATKHLIVHNFDAAVKSENIHCNIQEPEQVFFSLDCLNVPSENTSETRSWNGSKVKLNLDLHKTF